MTEGEAIFILISLGVTFAMPVVWLLWPRRKQ